MGCVARRLRSRGAIPLGCALAALWAAPATAESGTHLFTADAFRNINTLDELGRA